MNKGKKKMPKKGVKIGAAFLGARNIFAVE